MPLKKIVFKPGVNRENTRYTTEGGWYDCDKVRFRQGTPEKIGGWQQFSTTTYLGICRALWPWSTFSYSGLLGVGTNLKYYITFGGVYYDITPIRRSVVLTNPFSTTISLPTVTVTDSNHGALTGDYVTFSGATAVGGLTISGEYVVTVIDASTYTIGDFQYPLSGWGTGTWGGGTWGSGSLNTKEFRIWNHQNFGEDLIFGPRGGGLYYWDASSGLLNRGVALTSLPGASDAPVIQNSLLVSDASRFVLVFGCNDYGTSAQDPMLIRWSDQESAVNWTPAATNQAGSLRLSHGSEIVAVGQVRQEILVWTDTSMYSLQYFGPPIVWGSQLLSDNVSIFSDRAWSVAAGVTYWMGQEKFYSYDGRVSTLECDIRQYIFSDFNYDQNEQIFSSTVEQFNEVWWFYCSASSTEIDRYVIYNYLEKAWYYGTLNRTAWIDANVTSDYPIAATANKLVYHEFGVDDNTTGTPVPINAYITSSEFDIEDGDRFGFVWRVLPDITFRGSTAGTPSATLTLLPLQNSGSGYNSPVSQGGTNNGAISRVATVPIEQFTQQINVRVRGRQMALKIASDAVGVQWQLGAPRLDIKQDGRKS